MFRKPIARMLVVAGGGMLAGIIGLSRLELGVHWPTDLMAPIAHPSAPVLRLLAAQRSSLGSS